MRLLLLRIAYRCVDIIAIDSYWGAHPLRADRLARAPAARSGVPTGWRSRLGGSRKNGLPTTFRTPPAPYRERAYAKGPGFCCYAGNQFIASAGMPTFGTPSTRMRPGIAPVRSHGNSGLRQVITRAPKASAGPALRRNRRTSLEDR
jgi:hypothetical protein